MSTEQQYRVIGKSGPGVDWRSLPRDTMIKFGNDDPRRVGQHAPLGEPWNSGRYDILEAISPPQAEVATCESWCGLPFGDKRVPCASDHPSMVVESHAVAALCVQSLFVSNCTHPAYCTQACLDRARAAKAKHDTVADKCHCGMPGRRMRLDHLGGRCVRVLCPAHTDGIEAPWAAEEDAANAVSCRGVMCIRSACKAPPVAGGELCAAHAGQVEAALAAAPPAAPAPAETRLERWRREHKGYSHGTADPRLHDANVAAMMVARDGPREPYVPPPKPDPWTPRDLDGDIPDAWERGGARLGR